MKEVINGFEHDGILEPAAQATTANGEIFYHLSKRGYAWVNMLRSTPYPRAAWVDPRNDEIVP